jgi:succinate-semialdehyde dehydrogenase / glutarate-semialdehyde dehydrogenase
LSDTRLLFIGGSWRRGGDDSTEPVINPATEQPIARVTRADASDVDSAINAAVNGLTIWRTTPAEKRALILSDAAEIIGGGIENAAALLTLEQGKTITESRAEWARTVETLRWCAKAAEER